MLLSGIMSFIPFIKDIVTPFLAAAFFIYVPWAMVASLHGIWKLGTVFSPFSCVALLLSSIGVLFVASGFLAIKDYILYGHKLGKM